MTIIHFTARNVPPAAPKMAGRSIVWINSSFKDVCRVDDFPFFALLFPFPLGDEIGLPALDGNA